MQEYRCPLCQQILESEKEFTHHIRSHDKVSESFMSTAAAAAAAAATIRPTMDTAFGLRQTGLLGTS